MYVANTLQIHPKSNSSVRQREEANCAALLARAAALKQKQILQFEEVQLKAKMEKLDAESTAKIRVLEEYEHSENFSDGMNSYLDKSVPALTTSGHHTPAVKPKATSSFRTNQENDTNHNQVSATHDLHVKQENYQNNSRRSDESPVELHQVMLKPNITEMLITQQRLSNLPHREVPVFSGDQFELLSFLKVLNMSFIAELIVIMI